jgi:hypothetical protein
MGISGLAGCGGCYVNYGSGLKGAGGLVPDLLGRGCPSPGASLQVVAQAALGATVGAIAIGATTSSIPLLGGTLLTNPSIVLNVTTSGSGAGNGVASVQVTVPNVSTMLGNVNFQAFFLDGQAAMGLSMSRGLQTVFSR